MRCCVAATTNTRTGDVYRGTAKLPDSCTWPEDTGRGGGGGGRRKKGRKEEEEEEVKRKQEGRRKKEG